MLPSFHLGVLALCSLHNHHFEFYANTNSLSAKCAKYQFGLYSDQTLRWSERLDWTVAFRICSDVVIVLHCHFSGVCCAACRAYLANLHLISPSSSSQPIRKSSITRLGWGDPRYQRIVQFDVNRRVSNLEDFFSNDTPISLPAEYKSLDSVSFRHRRIYVRWQDSTSFMVPWPLPWSLPKTNHI